MPGGGDAEDQERGECGRKRITDVGANQYLRVGALTFTRDRTEGLT